MLKHLKDPVVLIFFAIALLVEVLALGLGWRQQVINSWPRVDATVVKKEVTANSNGKYEGLVTVTTDDRREIVVKTDWASADPAQMEEQLTTYKDGSKTSLPQNPDNKEDLRLPPDPVQGWLPWLLALGGSLFALVPIGVVAVSNRKDAVSIGGLVFVVAGGILMLIGAYFTVSKTIVLKHWTVTEATVQESRVGHRPGRRRPYYGIDAKMQYSVAGSTVTAMLGSRGGWADPSIPEGLITGEFAPGSKHQIRYNPENATLATYEAAWTLGYFWEALLTTFLGLCMAGLGWAMARFLK